MNDLTREDLLALLDSPLQGSEAPIHRELLDARLVYVDRCARARNGKATEEAHQRYEGKVVDIVLGMTLIDFATQEIPTRPDRNELCSLHLGDKYDADLNKARAEYLAQCVASHAVHENRDAWATYFRAMQEIVNDAIDAAARKAKSVRDRKVITVDRAAEPAPAPTVIVVEPVARPHIEVISVEHVPVADNGGRYVGLDRTGEQVTALAESGHATFLPSKEQEHATRGADIYSEYDKNVTERWKTPPPQVKRRKGVRA